MLRTAVAAVAMAAVSEVRNRRRAARTRAPCASPHPCFSNSVSATSAHGTRAPPVPSRAFRAAPQRFRRACAWRRKRAGGLPQYPAAGGRESRSATLFPPFPPLSPIFAGRRHRLVQDLGVHARHPDQGCAPWHQEHHRRHLPQLRHRHGPGQGALFEGGELIFPLPCPPSAELPAGRGCRGERPPPRVRGKAIRHKPRCAVAAGLGDEEPRETAAEDRA
jgi:hypothetical protein